MTVADRLIKVWRNIKQINNFWEKLPKSKQPSNKSYDTLKAAVLDELVIAKLGCFYRFGGYVQAISNSISNRSFNDVIFVFDLFKLLKNIFSVIIKPNIRNKCETALKPEEIDLHSSANHLVAKEINIVFVALTHIQELGEEAKFQKLLF